MKKIIYLMMFIILSAAVFADYMPNRMPINAYLTDNGDARLSGTYIFDFEIYDSPSGGTMLWDEQDVSIKVESGIFAYDLGVSRPLNISGSSNIYLEITIGSETLSPRDNISMAMFAYRAQQANNLTEANNYKMANLTLAEKITFNLGEIIDNIMDGWIKITGGLNITQDMIIEGNITSNGNITTKKIKADRVDIGSIIYNGTTGLILPAASAYAFETAAAANTGMYFDLGQTRYELHYLGAELWYLTVGGIGWIKEDLIIGGGDPTDDDYLYFDDNSSQYLAWIESSSPSRFLLSTDLSINDAVATDNDSIFFDDATQWLRWSDGSDGGTDRFELSNGLNILNGNLSAVNLIAQENLTIASQTDDPYMFKRIADALYLQHRAAGAAGLGMMPVDMSRGNDVIFGAFGLGTLDNTSSTETLYLGWSQTRRQYEIFTAALGTDGIAQSLNIYTKNNQHQLYLNKSGYVGIGTANPIRLLDINGSMNVRGNITLINGNITGVDYINVTKRVRALQYFTWTDQGVLIQNGWVPSAGIITLSVNGSSYIALFDGKMVGAAISCRIQGQSCAPNMSWGFSVNNTVYEQLLLPDGTFSNYTNSLSISFSAGDSLRVYAYNYTCVGTAYSDCILTMGIESE